MKTFSICTAIALFAALSHAAPFHKVARQEEVFLTFVGAPEAVHYHVETTAGEEFEIDEDISVSQIYGDPNFICYLYGIDGSETVVDTDEVAVDVGPPQVQVAGYCEAK